MPRETGRSISNDTPPEPWRSFLQELDEHLTEAIALHCLGGFVVSLHYGIGRQTSDIDFLAVVPRNHADDIEAIAGPKIGATSQIPPVHAASHGSYCTSKLCGPSRAHVPFLGLEASFPLRNGSTRPGPV